METALIIPTYNRPLLLAQLLRYLSLEHFGNPILVADSTPSPIADSNENIVRSQKGKIDVRYLRFDPDVTVASKLANTLATVDSKYSVICADDDYVLPRAIDQCSSFLESNSDYAVAGGYYIHLYATSITKRVGWVWRTPRSDDSRSKIWVFLQTPQTIDDADPVLRFRRFFSSEISSFYAVHRRENHLRNMRIAAKNTKHGLFMESLPCCLDLIQGKFRLLKVLLGVRPYHAPDYTYEPDLRWHLGTIVVSNDFSEWYKKFNNCLAEEMSVRANIPVEEVSKSIDRVFLTVLSNELRADSHLREIHKTPRSVKFLRLVLATVRAAILEREFTEMIRAPREFALTSYYRIYAFANRYRRLDKFVRQFPVEEYLQPILECLSYGEVG